MDHEREIAVDLDKEPMIKLAMTRQENRHNRPGMDLVRDEVSYGVRIFPSISLSRFHRM